MSRQLRTSCSIYLATLFYVIIIANDFTNNIIVVDAKLFKMCLSGYTPSGHARSDPIISQTCASDHVHTFYGPQNFHPQTSYEDIRDTPHRFSTTPFVENQSLYWHPTIYEVIGNDDGTKTYIRAKVIESTPYYRWDDSSSPPVEAFSPGFRMIAHSNDDGANQGELDDEFNLRTECCLFQDNAEVQCDYWNDLHFPNSSCDYLEIVFAMPTCWNGSSLGDNNDHKSHMRYTTNGKVNGSCPNGFNRRIPQIQLTVSVLEYNGGTYQLSDGSDVWHVDFFNGWQEKKLQEIIDNCEPTSDDEDDPSYNPPCSCSPEEGDDFMTFNEEDSGSVCDSDVRELIIDEAIDVTDTLPRGSCKGSNLISKSWTELSDNLLDCKSSCVDTTTNFLVKNIPRSCSWVKTNTKKRCAKGGNKVAKYCPKTCGTCTKHACVNAPQRFYLANGKLKSCKWVARKKSRCNKVGVALICRATCSNPMCDALGRSSGLRHRRKNIFERL